MARHADTRRPSKITIPERCHPLAKVVFAEMKRQNVSYDELEHRAGVLRSTFKAWRTNNKPGLETIEAALGALGWAVLPVPDMAEIPDSVRDGLKELAGEWADENELLCGLMATVCQSAVISKSAPAAPLPDVLPAPKPRRRKAQIPENQTSLF